MGSQVSANSLLSASVSWLSSTSWSQEQMLRWEGSVSSSLMASTSAYSSMSLHSSGGKYPLASRMIGLSVSWVFPFKNMMSVTKGPYS